MKDSEILRKAKVFLDSKYPSMGLGVCYAINQVAVMFPDTDTSRLKRWVSEMIGTHNVFISDWLVANGHAARSDFGVNFNLENRHKLKATRLAWLDWMIAECEKDEVLK